MTEERDGAGRITRVEAGTSAWTVGYDQASGAATSFDGPGATLQRVFDGTDLVSEAWTGAIDAAVTRRLDAAGRVLGETVVGSPEITYGYDPAGRVVQAGNLQITRDGTTGRITTDKLGSLVRTWSHDSFGAVVGMTVTSGSTTVYDVMLVRDRLGRVTRRTEQLPGGAVHTQLFEYSPLGYLTAVTDDSRTTTSSTTRTAILSSRPHLTGQASSRRMTDATPSSGAEPRATPMTRPVGSRRRARRPGSRHTPTTGRATSWPSHLHPGRRSSTCWTAQVVASRARLAESSSTASATSMAFVRRRSWTATAT